LLAIPEQFSQFHSFGKRGDDKDEHWEEDSRDKGNGMIMGAMGRGKSLWVVKNRLVFGEKRLYVGMNSRGGGLNCLNGMELCNNARVTFFE
jgi:hypothetical protein